MTKKRGGSEGGAIGGRIDERYEPSPPLFFYEGRKKAWRVFFPSLFRLPFSSLWSPFLVLGMVAFELWSLIVSNGIYEFASILFFCLNVKRVKGPAPVWRKFLELCRIYAWFHGSHLLIFVVSSVWHTCFYGAWCFGWEGSWVAATTNLDVQGPMVFDLFGVLFALPSTLSLLYPLTMWNEGLICLDVVLAMLCLAFIPGFVTSLVGGAIWAVIILSLLMYKTYQLYLRVPTRARIKTKLIVLWVLIYVFLFAGIYFKLSQIDSNDVRHSLWHVCTGMDSVLLVLVLETFLQEQDAYMESRGLTYATLPSMNPPPKKKQPRSKRIPFRLDSKSGKKGLLSDTTGSFRLSYL